MCMLSQKEGTYLCKTDELLTATVLWGYFREYHPSSAALVKQHPEVTHSWLVGSFQTAVVLNHHFLRKLVQGENRKELSARPLCNFMQWCTCVYIRRSSERTSSDPTKWATGDTVIGSVQWEFKYVTKGFSLYWTKPRFHNSCLESIMNKWLLGRFWTLFAQCCWQGVAFPKKALRHIGCEQFVSFTQISATFLFHIQFPLDRISFTLLPVAPFMGPDGVLSPLRWASMHLHCSMKKQGGLADDFFFYSVHIVIDVFISPTAAATWCGIQ